ncbi:MAG: hypothetical protein WHX52_21455 [Anaerolineae bacterium]
MLESIDFLLPMLIFLLIGIVVITFWLAWVIFKMRYKKQFTPDKATQDNEPLFSAVPREAPLLAVARASDGAWEITVNGKHYPNLEAVPDEAVRQDVVAGLKEVVAFARSYVQKEQAGRKPPTPPQPGPEPAAQGDIMPMPPASAPTMPENRIPPAEKPVSPETPLPFDAATRSSPSDRLRGLFKGDSVLKRPDAMPRLMPAIDLAREIGEIVAQMQAQIPALAQRAIKLQNSPSGGVQFVIDDMIYFDVNEIPDADVQALIRAATKEWERR